MDDETVANNSTSERFFSPHTHLPSVCVFYVHREKYNKKKEWRNERKKNSMKRCVIADIDSAVKRKID